MRKQLQERIPVQKSRLDRWAAALDRLPILQPTDFKKIVWCVAYFPLSIMPICTAVIEILSDLAGTS